MGKIEGDDMLKSHGIFPAGHVSRLGIYLWDLLRLLQCRSCLVRVKQRQNHDTPTMVIRNVARILSQILLPISILLA
jgi:hypothetical protein